MAADGGDREGPRKLFWSLVGSQFTTIAVVIFDLWLAVWILLPKLYPDRAEAGQLGDSFGVVTSLFSGLTLLGAGYAVWLQREELKVVRKENKDAEVERGETIKLLARQTEALLTAAKLQAVHAIGQLDTARFQFHQIDLEKASYRDLKTVLDRVDASRQFAEILLHDAESPDFDWGEVPSGERTPIRKFYLAKLRRTIGAVSAIPEDTSLFEAIGPLLELQMAIRTLSGQDASRSMGNLFRLADDRLERAVVWLRAELGVRRLEPGERLTSDDFDLEEELSRDPSWDHFDARRKAVVLGRLRELLGEVP